jgi:hypothetical protein
MTIELSCLRSGFRGKARHLSETFLGSAVLSVLVLLLATSSWAQPAPETVNIQVQVDQSQGPLPPIWNFFGYDEPNYTYAPNGKKLLGELAALSPARLRSRSQSFDHGGWLLIFEVGIHQRLHRRRRRKACL